MRFINTCGFLITIAVLFVACQNSGVNPPDQTVIADSAIKPVFITDTVAHDSDDPAIWINFSNPSESLVLGTDKEDDGALYVFDLRGKIQKDKIIRGLKRPNNVDVEYGLLLSGRPTDIAVVTERFTHKLRVYSLPDMKPIDGNGLEMFAGDTATDYRDLMGIGLYKDRDGNIYAMVGRKNGPRDGSYIWQYLLSDNGKGLVKATLVRKFGKFSGKKEIESIAVDDALGYVYYSDEGFGVRKYYADPAKGNEELAVLGATGFTQDHEGISIYAMSDSTGYILVSDQQANRFHLFAREGDGSNPHNHRFIKSILLSTNESDGSEITAVPLDSVFCKGLFVAMSTDKTFQYYRWEDLMK